MNLKLLNVAGIGALIKQLGSIIDKVVTNKGEKEKLRLQIFEIIYQLDMGSDSWLSKNIRPLSLLFILILFASYSILDGHGYEIQAIYRDTTIWCLKYIVPSYFGLRELGKHLTKKRK